jgi:ankyrin repeat protein
MTETIDKGKALFDAAYHGDAAAVDALLIAGAPLDARDKRRNTPLMVAAANGHDDTVGVLIDSGTYGNVYNFGSIAAYGGYAGVAIYSRGASADYIYNQGSITGSIWTGAGDDTMYNGVDGVWCERVLQHVVDADRVIGEFARVTRPGGRICLIDTDWESLAFDGLPDAWAAEVTAHMHGGTADGQPIGRTLRRRLVRAGLSEVVSSADYESGAVTSEDLDDKEVVHFDRLGVAVVSGNEAVQALAAAASDADSPIQLIEPEYVAQLSSAETASR